MVNAKEIKAILKKHKIQFYSYWNKKRLLDLANEHKLLSKKASGKEKSRNPKYRVTQKNETHEYINIFSPYEGYGLHF